MQIDVDVRLAAAAGGAARYFADAAGLGHDDVSQLQAAVIAACTEAFHEVQSNQASLNVTLTRLVDRIEVSVAHKGTADVRAAGADALEGVDEIRHETHDGIVFTRLTKFIKQGAASR